MIKITTPESIRNCERLLQLHCVSSMRHRQAAAALAVAVEVAVVVIDFKAQMRVVDSGDAGRVAKFGL